MFKKKKKGSIYLGALKEVAELTPPVEWVYSLLMHMYQDSIGNFILRKSDGIPSIPLQDKLPEGELSFDKIINVLKVICGLDPIDYTEIKEGNHSLFIHGKSYTAKMLFDDSANDPIYRISMSIVP